MGHYFFDGAGSSRRRRYGGSCTPSVLKHCS
jgi:hypothetical protein